MPFDSVSTFWLALAALVLFALFTAIRMVPQSEKHVVERLGKFKRVLDPGLSLIFPFFDRVPHKVSILERQLPRLTQDCITSDNVLLKSEVAVFYRVTSPERTVYRIRDVDDAVATTVAGIVRSEIGKIELDEVQSNRAALNAELKSQLVDATDDWGIEVTRAEILDVNLDDATRNAMLQQLNADRERRATIARAEGEKSAMQLQADAELYTAQRLADAVRVKAEADAYATETVAQAIAKHGLDAIEYDVRKRQVEAVAALAKGEGKQTIILPAELAESLGHAAKLFGGKK